MVLFSSGEPVQSHRGTARPSANHQGAFFGWQKKACAFEQLHVRERLMAGLKLEEARAR